MAPGTYTFFDHAADVGLAVAAPSFEELLRTAARGVMAWTGPPPVGRKTSSLVVELEAADRGELVVRWLQELVVLFQVRRLYTTEMPELRATDTWLRARIEGRLWDDADIGGFREVKAVTYHGLEVAETAGGWTARVILDL